MSDKIPDFIEQGEARAELYLLGNTDARNYIRCIACQEFHDPLGMLGSTPDPYSPPICSDCAGWPKEEK